MFDDVDKHPVTLGPDGSLVIPATLLEKLGWRPGHRLLLEQTDDGVLVPEMTVAAKWAMRDAAAAPKPPPPEPVVPKPKPPRLTRSSAPMGSFANVPWSAIWIESQLPVSEREADCYGLPDCARGRPRPDGDTAP